LKGWYEKAEIKVYDEINHAEIILWCNNYYPNLRKLLPKTKLDDFYKAESNKQAIPTDETNFSKDLKEKCFSFIRQKDESSMSELIVKDILEKNHIYTTKNDLKEEVWIYEDGIYLPQGKSSIKVMVRNILDCFYTEQRANRVIAKIETDTYIEEKEFFNINYKEELPVLNGILNVVTLELSEFNPKKIFFGKIPVTYNPHAKCPKINKFLSEVLRNDEDIIVMKEVAGYGLYKENFLEMAAMFNGEGRNGKGKTQVLFTNLYGLKNVCGVPLSRMTDESFSLSGLFGKLANIGGDLKEFTMKDTGTLKMVLGRDLVNTKRKFLTDLEFTPYAKQIFACNTLPIVYDQTLGFWSKWILFDFPYTFMTKEEFDNLPEEDKQRTIFKEKDFNIIEKITTSEELSGFLNESLEGLHRILKNGKFSTTKGTSEVKEEWVRKSDSCMAFCMDFIMEDADGIISKKDFRKKFSDYCKKHRIKSASDKAILITLETHFGVSSKQMGYGEYVWEGIRWK